jgi:ABC transporter with metal-binding/Fe-S-binding domain ATP-binding protein
MRLAVLFSGGKDSTYAAWLAKKEGYELSCLVSIESENKHSFMFHTPSISKVEKQAEAMGIPLIKVKTKGEKEKELGDLEEAIKKAVAEYGVEGVVTGAVESVYQASRVQKICNKLGIECFNPLWQKDPEEYWKEMLNLNFKIVIAGVAADGLGENLLGREINAKELNQLKKLSNIHKFHLGFEGGEAETFVLDCPLFKKSLEVVNAEKIWNGSSGTFEIKEIKLIDK